MLYNIMFILITRDDIKTYVLGFLRNTKYVFKLYSIYVKTLRTT
jgi:hypothetical protein